MKENKQNPLLAVLKREIDRMISRRIYFGVTIILPLFCILFMATIFNNGQMENIPIGVVDMDGTATSRNIIRNVDAVPTMTVTKHFANPAEARLATQRKEIYGYMVIPSDFENRMMDGKSTTINYYYHYALLSVGSEILGAFENVLEPIALTPTIMKGASLGLTSDQIMSFIMPTNQRSNALFNPDLDYSVYLSNPFFFVFLQILVLLTTVYIVGSELKFHTAEDWLEKANGNMLIAIVGKFIPYTIIFSCIAIFGNYIMFGMLHIPFSCGFLPLNLSSVLLIIASQALALFVFTIFPVMGIIISIVSMIGSLGATLCGVTFPAPDMYPVIHGASYLLPIRHFVMINQNLLYGDYGFAYTWINWVVLILYIVPPLFLLSRLKRVIIEHKYEGIR